MFDRLSGVLAKIILALFFLLLFCAGILIGGTAFHDPDTCWILALGRYMFEHGSIPTIEPFSYTFADVHRPLVLYQWLAELSFYLAVKIGGLATLLATISFLVMTAYIVIPLKLFAIAKVRWSFALLIILVGTIASSFHFLARPEIISYVLLSSLLFLLTTHRLAFRDSLVESAQPFNGKTVALIALTMAIWANFHTGFVSGVVVLAAYLSTDTISRLLFKVKPICDLTILAALVAGAVASLVNPYGIGLWQYIPSLFFAKFNHLIMELNPVDPRKAEFIPFLFFLTIFIFVWLGQFKQSKNLAAHLLLKRKMLNCESLVIFVICLLEGWSHLRLIPFVVLIILNELILLSARSPFENPEPGLLSILDAKLGQGLAPPVPPGSVACAALVLAIGVGGTLLTSLAIQPPILPQSGGAFSLPLRALEIVSMAKTTGNLLNDPQFGDALIWYHPCQPKVFIDTRFDMYGENLVRDYLSIVRTEPGWQRLLDKYDITTVFLQPRELLVEKLRCDSSWHVDYADKNSVILSRTGAR